MDDAQLKAIADAFEAKAGISTPTNDNMSGRWKKIAIAAESIAGVASFANETIAGYMYRTAVALEAKYGGSGAEENNIYDGLLKRVIDALEIPAGVSAGTDETRLYHAITNLTTIAPTLHALTAVTAFTLPENAAAGTPAGTITGNTFGSTLSLTNDAGGRVALSGTTVVRGAVALDYETATSHSFTVREVLAGATNTPLDTVLTLNVTDVVEPQSAFVFGTMTLAGEGAVPITGTAIASDPTGHWQVITDSTNFGTPTKMLAPSPAGATAALNAGPYTIGMDDGQVITITTLANARHIRTQAERDAFSLALATNLKGKRLILRRDSYRGGSPLLMRIDGASTGSWPQQLKNGDYLGLSIEGEVVPYTAFVPPTRAADPCTIDKVITTGGSGYTITQLAFTMVKEQKIQWKGGNGFNSTNVHFTKNYIAGVTADPYGDYSNSSNYPNLGITTVGNAGSANGTYTGSFTFVNNVLEDGEKLFEAGADLLGDADVVVSGNFCRRAYADAIHVTNGAGTAATRAWVEDNYCTQTLGLFSDSGGPHGDYIQLQGSNASLYDFEIHINRNIMIDGAARGGAHGIFCSSLKLTTGTGKVYTGEISGNLYVGDHNDAITVSQVGNLICSHNTCVQRDNRLRDNQVTIRLGGDNSGDAYTRSGTTQTVTNNVADYINTTYLGAGSTVSNNVVLGQGGSTIPYSTAFAGTDFTASPTLPADAIARFTPKAGGPLDVAGTVEIGAVTYVNWPTTIPGNDGSVVASSSITWDTTGITWDSTAVTMDHG